MSISIFVSGSPIQILIQYLFNHNFNLNLNLNLRSHNLYSQSQSQFNLNPISIQSQSNWNSTQSQFNLNSISIQSQFNLNSISIQSQFNLYLVSQTHRLISIFLSIEKTASKKYRPKWGGRRNVTNWKGLILSIWKGSILRKMDGKERRFDIWIWKDYIKNCEMERKEQTLVAVLESCKLFFEASKIWASLQLASS
jgi:hypothetical protein